jgi:glycosyltransferase involved in cell wall biosynthesis
VIYGSTLKTFSAIDAAHARGIPSLWNIRESEPWRTYYRDLPHDVACTALRCFAYPYRIIFDSNACRALFNELNSNHNFCVIHTGLNLDAWMERMNTFTRDAARRRLAVGSSDVCVLLLGTVCERKGQHDLAHALARLSSLAARLRCFIVGDRASEYSRQLHHLVADLPEDFRDRVHIMEETGDVGVYYQAADIFLCTSRIESYPRVTLEAMASGLPIISTPVFGLTEQLVDNVNAMLYQPGDVAALGAAIERLVHDDALRNSMGSQSRPVLAGLKNFDEMIDEYARYFQEAADSK